MVDAKRVIYIKYPYSHKQNRLTGGPVSTQMMTTFLLCVYMPERERVVHHSFLWPASPPGLNSSKSIPEENRSHSDKEELNDRL